MAHFRKEVEIAAPGDHAWDALRDVGALHTRLVLGFVTDCRLEGDVRTVTFANGAVAKERMVDVSESERRVAWSAAGGPLSHHNASAQVVSLGPDRCKVVWIVDLLPNEMAQPIAAMVDAALMAMKKTLESAPRG
ncbi:MAG: SRPBCC family protein [Terriglobales bacterium]